MYAEVLGIGLVLSFEIGIFVSLSNLPLVVYEYVFSFFPNLFSSRLGVG